MFRLTLLILLLGAGAGAYLIGSRVPDVAPLKEQFAAVIYHGPDQPFEVKLHRSRPPGYVSLSQISRVAVGAIVVYHLSYPGLLKLSHTRKIFLLTTS